MSATLERHRHLVPRALPRRRRRRTFVVVLSLAAAVVVSALVALGLGDLTVNPVEVASALTGGSDSLTRTVVVEWRLPRIAAAVIFGVALGVSGAVFQSLTSNPLASPDVIGLTAGSYTGGVIAMIVVGAGAGSLPVAAGSIVGGLGAAALVYTLAYRDGVRGFRLIVVGIGISAMLAAVSTFLVLRARLEVAMTVSVWGAGSLNPVGWDQVAPAAVVIVAALVGLAVLSRSMRQLELGDDTARAHGVNVDLTRLLLIVCGVALCAAVTAAAGPIAFVALAAPQVARRLTRSAESTLLPAALVGALVLVVADAVGQHALSSPLPVGVVTVVVGGAYLIGLLIRETRRRA